MSKPKCEICRGPRASGEWLCSTCRNRLKRVVESTRTINTGAIELRNVKLTTDLQGAPAVVAIGSESTGVQRPIQVDGPTKCLICDEWTTDMVVCGSCTNAVNTLRAIAGEQQLIQVLRDLAENPAYLDMMILIKDGLFEKVVDYYMAEIEGTDGHIDARD